VMSALAATIVLDRLDFWMLPLTAFVQSGASIFVSAASAGALRAVVPTLQLPAASAVVTGRDAAVSLAAPPLGGALLGIARSLPFVVASVAYAVAALALYAMRTPFQEERERDRSSVRQRLAEGFRFLWHHDFIRTSAFLFGLANFVGPGVLFAIVVIGKEEGLSGGEVGVLLAAFGVCILIGSFLSPLVRRVLPVRGVMLLELWTWPGCALFLVWPNVYVLTASILPTALAIPSTNSVVDSYQLALTPDRLVGRVEGVRLQIALLIAPLGPLVAGLLLETASERATIAVFAAFGLVLAVWGTLSPSIRSAPRLEDVTELPTPATTS
jgi:predicted MFS family arabinose efflux permease